MKAYLEFLFVVSLVVMFIVMWNAGIVAAMGVAVFNGLIGGFLAVRNEVVKLRIAIVKQGSTCHD